MKIWCEECKGTGERHESHMTADKGICFVDGTCPSCEGRGWNKPNGPTARAFIEAEMKELEENSASEFNRGAIWMGKFALECLDKSEESMVSINVLREAYWRTYFDNPVGFQKWLKDLEGKQ